jgi:putative hemin transport protein
MSTSTLDPIAELKDNWARLRETEPKLRIRDAAAKLGVSEGELLATGIGEHVTRLKGDFREIFKRLPEVGHVMALTRNETIVHERHGQFRHVEFFGPVMGQVVGPDIDLRLFMHRWHNAFAVTDKRGEETLRSLQFFDKDGTALHKIYLQEDGNLERWEEIVTSFTAEEQEPGLSVEAVPPAPADLPDSDIDVAAFQEGWRNLQDTHEFFGLVRKNKVGRLQAVRLAPEGMARQVGNDALRKVLNAASAQKAEIMVFVMNAGLFQIHTGPVDRIVDYGDWLNVLDPEFNLHVKEPAIAQSWAVLKPTRDGHVSSLELFDASGENIALLFGKRKPGEAESEQWRAILASL